MLSFKTDNWSNRSRWCGLKALCAPAAAVLLCLGSVAVVAQTAVFDFEDPLEQVQTQIQKTQQDRGADPAQTPEPANGGWAASTAAADSENAAPPQTGNAAAAPAAQSGFSNNEMLAILAALFLALAALVAWMFFGRREPVRESRRGNAELYAARRERRTLESGAQAKRAKQVESRSHTAPASEETQAEDAPRIFKREPPRATMIDAEVDTKQPENWKKPNLDRLKASIRADWAGSKSTAPQKPKAYDDEEAKAYAELFGDEPSPAKSAPVTKGDSVSDLLDTFEVAPDDAPAPVEELRKTVQRENADLRRQAKTGSVSREEALRRVRALRDSVKTG